MTLLKPASGIIKNRTDKGFYKLESFDVDKNGVTYTCIPEIAILFKNESKKKDLVINAEDYWRLVERYENYVKDEYFAEKYSMNISIVTTGHCEGGCKYCYAKDGWKIDQYITPEEIDAVCYRNKVDELGTVIVYGGEPLLNFNAFEKLFNHLVFNKKAKHICATTGLFFDDETFEKVKGMLVAYSGKFSISVSIDPPARDGEEYLRKYTGGDSYRFVLDRLIDLAKISDDIGIRMTLNRGSGNPFDMIDEIENRTGRRMGCTIEPVSSGSEEFTLDQEGLERIKNTYTKYMNEEIYSKKRVANKTTVPKPLSEMMVNPRKMMFQVMKNCDMGSNRLAVLPDGGVDICSENVELGKDKVFNMDKEKLFKQIYGLENNKECQACDWKYTCGKKCHKFIDSKEFETNYKSYCDYHIFCAVEAVKFFVFHLPEDELNKHCNHMQEVAGISFE